MLAGFRVSSTSAFVVVVVVVAVAVAAVVVVPVVDNGGEKKLTEKLGAAINGKKCPIIAPEMGYFFQLTKLIFSS